jgi:hypothetical protein
VIENKEVIPAENPKSADSAPKPAEVGLGGFARCLRPFIAAFDFSYGFPTIDFFATIGAFEKLQFRDSVFTAPMGAG